VIYSKFHTEQLKNKYTKKPQSADSLKSHKLRLSSHFLKQFSTKLHSNAGHCKFSISPGVPQNKTSPHSVKKSAPTNKHFPLHWRDRRRWRSRGWWCRWSRYRGNGNAPEWR